jgi:hypothetical protein
MSQKMAQTEASFTHDSTGESNESRKNAEDSASEAANQEATCRGGQAGEKMEKKGAKAA